MTILLPTDTTSEYFGPGMVQVLGNLHAWLNRKMYSANGIMPEHIKSNTEKSLFPLSAYTIWRFVAVAVVTCLEGANHFSRSAQITYTPAVVLCSTVCVSLESSKNR